MTSTERTDKRQEQGFLSFDKAIADARMTADFVIRTLDKNIR